jgi:hypothetical protein
LYKTGHQENIRLYIILFQKRVQTGVIVAVPIVERDHYRFVGQWLFLLHMRQYIADENGSVTFFVQVFELLPQLGRGNGEKVGLVATAYFVVI